MQYHTEIKKSKVNIYVAIQGDVSNLSVDFLKSNLHNRLRV